MEDQLISIQIWKTIGFFVTLVHVKQGHLLIADALMLNLKKKAWEQMGTEKMIKFVWRNQKAWSRKLGFRR